MAFFFLNLEECSQSAKQKWISAGSQDARGAAVRVRPAFCPYFFQLRNMYPVDSGKINNFLKFALFKTEHKVQTARLQLKNSDFKTAKVNVVSS